MAIEKKMARFLRLYIWVGKEDTRRCRKYIIASQESIASQEVRKCFGEAM